MTRYSVDLFDKKFVYQNTFDCENNPELYYDYITAEKSTIVLPKHQIITRGDFSIVRINGTRAYDGYVSNYEYSDDQTTKVTMMPLLYLLSNDIYLDISILNNKLETAEQLITRSINFLYHSDDAYQNIEGLEFVNPEGNSTYADYEEKSDRIYNLLDIVVDFFKNYGLIVDMQLDPNTRHLYVTYNYVNPYKLHKIKADFTDIFEYSWNNANTTDKPNKITYFNKDYYEVADAIAYLKSRVRSNTDFDREYKSQILAHINTIIDNCDLSKDGEMTSDITQVLVESTVVTKNTSHYTTSTQKYEGITTEISEDSETTTDKKGKETVKKNRTVTTTWTKLSPPEPDKYEHSWSHKVEEVFKKSKKLVAVKKTSTNYSKTITHVVTRDKDGNITNDQVTSNVKGGEDIWNYNLQNTSGVSQTFNRVTVRQGEDAGNWTETVTRTKSETPDGGPGSYVRPRTESSVDTTTYNAKQDKYLKTKATTTDDDDVPKTKEQKKKEKEEKKREQEAKKRERDAKKEEELNQPAEQHTYKGDNEVTNADIQFIPGKTSNQTMQSVIDILNRVNDSTTPDEQASGTFRGYFSFDPATGRVKSVQTGNYVTGINYTKKTHQSRTTNYKGEPEDTETTTYTFNCNNAGTTGYDYVEDYSITNTRAVTDTTTDTRTHQYRDANNDMVTVVTEVEHEVYKQTNLDTTGKSGGSFGDYSTRDSTTTTVTTKIEGHRGQSKSSHSEVINTSYKRNTGVETVTRRYVSPITDPYADTRTYSKSITDSYSAMPVVDEATNTTTNYSWEIETVYDENHQPVDYSKRVTTEVSSSNTTQGTIKTIARKRVDTTSTEDDEITSQSSKLTETTTLKTQKYQDVTTTVTTYSAEGPLGTQDNDISPYVQPTDENIGWTKTINEEKEHTDTTTGERTSSATTTKYTYSPDVKETYVTNGDDEEDNGGVWTLHIWQNLPDQKYQKNWVWNEWLDFVAQKMQQMDVSITYYYHPSEDAIGGGTVDTDSTTNRVLPVYSATKTIAPATTTNATVDGDTLELSDGKESKKTFAETAYDDAYNLMYLDRYDDYLVLDMNRKTKLFDVGTIGDMCLVQIDDIKYKTILTGYTIVNDAEVRLTFGMQRQSLTQRLREMEKKINS